MSSDLLSAHEARNRRRARLRRILVWSSLPVALFGALVVVKLLSMFVLAHLSISAYVDGDYPESARQAEPLQTVNVVETWKAHFDLGTAYAGERLLPEAQAEYEKALPMADVLSQCMIRINLALVLEWQGDDLKADGKIGDSLLFYDQAISVLSAADPSCFSGEASSSSSDPNRDTGEEAQDNQDRLEEKSDEARAEQSEQGENGGQGGDQGDDAGQGGENQPDESQLEQIEDQLDQGAEEKDDFDAQNRGEDAPWSGTDKPW